MELYHIHLLGYHDSLYKVGSTININPKIYNNRLYDRIYNKTTSPINSNYKIVEDRINESLKACGYKPFDKVPFGEIIAYLYGELSQISANEFRWLVNDNSSNIMEVLAIALNALKDSSEYILKDEINTREMALEDYRYHYHENLPSRLHSMYACNEDGLEYWINNINDGPADIYQIDAENEPFLSSSLLLPDVSLPYGKQVELSKRYFEPKDKYLHTFADEYLVQGRVRVRSKIDEVGR